MSIDRLLQETEAPTTAEGDVAKVSDTGSDVALEDGSWALKNMFKVREHEVDTAAQGGKEEVTTEGGHRHLLVLSDKDTDTSLLQNFDPISVTDNMSPGAIFESLSRGEVTPTDSPYQITSTETIETLCPTWGPSSVPRRHFGDLLPSDDFLDAEAIEPYAQLNNTAREKNTNSHPGRARHSQHQLVELDPMTSLDSSSVQVPSPEEAKRMRTLVDYSDELAGLRIVFDTSSLSLLLRDMGHNFATMNDYNPTKARISAYTESILPSIANTWSQVLKIFPASRNIFPPSTCEQMPIPEKHLENGVANADVVIYVKPREEIESCSVDPRPQITICQFDQDMRPLVGLISICLNNMDVQDNSVYDKEILHHTALLSQLMGRFLGLSPSMFRYFRDPESGQLYGERPMAIECGDEEQMVTQETKLSNIIQQHDARDGEPFYKIVTPSVSQVVRNHFDCQSMSGAILDIPLPDPNGQGGCSFFDLDLRYHFDEDMTSISQNADSAFGVSPLSLALLEDSSWYKANFAASVTPSFGRGAGCGFVQGSCIIGGKVPDYSVGYFCASIDHPGQRSGCDYSHDNKAGCELETDISPPPNYQYFLPSNPEYGSPFEDMQYCPMQSNHLIPCSTKGHAVAVLPGETYEENSKCYETDANVPVCLETICNPKDKTMSVVVNGKSFYCAYHGQKINIEAGYSIICPRIAAVCPDLICPSNCSGKGLCDYCKEVPECICDNPFDKTDGCWDS